MDLHAPGEHCNTYDCSGVVMRHDYDALAARLAREVADNDSRLLRFAEYVGASDKVAAFNAEDRTPDNGTPAHEHEWFRLSNWPGGQFRCYSCGQWQTDSADEDDPWYPNDQP